MSRAKPQRKSTSSQKKRTRNPEEKRELILEASLREFARFGFAGARADRIAIAANVSVGTVFKIFEDKTRLANAVFTHCLNQIQNGLGPILMGDLDCEEAFTEMWSFYVRMITQHQDVLMFYDYQPNSDFLDPENQYALAKVRQGLLIWIEKHQRSGKLKNVSTEALRALAVGSLMRILREFVNGNTIPKKGTLDALRTLVWDAIRA